MFSCGFCEIFKNTFFVEHLQTTASDKKTFFLYSQSYLLSKGFMFTLFYLPCMWNLQATTFTKAISSKYYSKTLRKIRLQNQSIPMLDRLINKKLVWCLIFSKHVLMQLACFHLNFHVFQIVQMVPNRATHQIYVFSLKF